MTLRIDLSRRHAVVSGGASGIGRAIAVALKGCGAQVTIIDLDEAALRSTAAEHGFTGYPLDVTDGKAVRAAAQAVDAADPVHCVVEWFI